MRYVAVWSCQCRSKTGKCHFPNKPKKHNHMPQCPYHSSSLLSSCKKLNPEEKHKKEATEKRKKMKLITLHLPQAYIQALDDLVHKKYYPNRAEAIRTAVRDLLSVEAWHRK